MGLDQCGGCEEPDSGPPDLRLSEGIAIKRNNRQIESVMPKNMIEE